MKGIYRGPSDYWNEYSLVPRERYYYGYYGTYGPDVDLSKYEPIGIETIPSLSANNNRVTNNNIFMEKFGNRIQDIGTFWTVILCIIISWFLLRCFRLL